MHININKAAFFCFFLLYLILPEYFAFEVSSALPLLTVSRIILIATILVYLASHKWKIQLRLCDDRKINQWLYIYFVGMLVIDFFNIKYSTDSLKAIFTVIFEEWAVIWIITQIVSSRERFIKAICLLVYSSGIVAIIAIIGSISGTNLFYSLNTVNRAMLQANYVRIGFLRAEAGFGHPVYYGMYCVLMIVLAFYLYEHYQEHKWLSFSCILLDTLGVFFANSRGSLVVCAFVYLMFFLNKNQYIFKRYVLWIITACFILVIVCLIFTPVRTYIQDLIQSLLAILDKSITVDNYGGNAGGMGSRIAQLTAIWYVIKHSPLFGFGAKSHSHGLIKWFRNGEWRNLTSFDMGIVATVCQYGLIGLFLQVTLFYQCIRIPFKNRKKDPTYRMFLIIIIAYLLGLLTISNLHDTLWVLIALTVSYINIDYDDGVKTRL